MNNEFFLNLSEVIKITGIARSTIYYMIDSGTFPKQTKLGERRAVWKKTDIYAWLESKGISVGFNRPEYAKGYRAAMDLVEKIIKENESNIGTVNSTFLLGLLSKGN